MTHTPKRITVHCTDSKNGVPYDIEKIRQIHVKEKGFDEIGYHAVIQPDGELQWGRGLNLPGAHVEKANTGNIGICLVGADRFTKAQFEKLAITIKSIQMAYSSIDLWDVNCHSEFDSARKQGKTCPNINPKRLIYWLWTNDYAVLEPYLLKESK